MPSDDEDDDEDDGSDSGRSDISNKPARRGGKSAMDKKERRKATNRACTYATHQLLVLLASPVSTLTPFHTLFYVLHSCQSLPSSKEEPPHRHPVPDL